MNTNGVPKFYADYDYAHWLIAPSPDAAYPWEILYWALPPPLDATNTTNWLTNYAPNTLLHASLVELYGFLNQPDQMALWKQEYDRDMGALVGEDLQKIVDRYYKRQTS